MDGHTDGHMDGHKDGWTYGRTDIINFRVASLLKIGKKKKERMKVCSR